MLSVPHLSGLLLILPASPLWLQVFYLDSLKFFLSLYGHKLPVLCMDISSDSTLLVSGSADKNIKVGGAGLRHRALLGLETRLGLRLGLPGN